MAHSDAGRVDLTADQLAALPTVVRIARREDGALVPVWSPATPNDEAEAAVVALLGDLLLRLMAAGVVTRAGGYWVAEELAELAHDAATAAFVKLKGGG